MPKLVDHNERRRILAESIIAVASDAGLGSATLRAVAKQAGMSMGTVQHYFANREQMLDFVLEYVQQERSERITLAISALPDPQPHAMLWAMIREVLSPDEKNLAFQKVHLMFVARAMSHEATATKLNAGRTAVVQLFRQLLGDCGVDEAPAAAEALWSLMDTLPTGIVLGQCTSEQALETTERTLAAFGVGYVSGA